MFLLALLCFAIASTGLWQCFATDKLYHCTDSGWLDFLAPGQWVHHPVVATKIVASRSMSEPDTIKAGWSITGLWCLWFSLVGASIIGSTLFSWRLPMGESQTERFSERTR